MTIQIGLLRSDVVAVRALERLHTAASVSAGVLIELAFMHEPHSAFTTLVRLLTRVDTLVNFQLTRYHEAFVAISAFELLDAIVAILVFGQIALQSDALAAYMAYKRFLARVDEIVNIEMTLLIGGVIASIASVLLPSIHLRPLALLIAFEAIYSGCKPIRSMDHGRFKTL